MLIECNRPGGFNVGGVVLSKGANEVEEEVWKAAAAKAPPGWLEDLSSPGPNGEAPQIVLPQGETSAKAKVKAVKACSELEVVELMAQGETRKTVLAAIDERITELLQERGD